MGRVSSRYRDLIVGLRSCVVVRLLMMRRWIVPALLLVLLLLVSLLGFSLPWLDRFGSYLMVAAAIALLVVAGRMSRR
jgi:hypothetical protein